MMFSSLSAAFALSTLVAAPVASASTQPILNGPVIAGVCVLSPEAVLAGSKVGQAANARFQQLAADAQGDMQAERTSLNTEITALQASAKTVPAAQVESRRQALSARLKRLQDKVDQRNQALGYTRTDVVQRISQQAQPLISAAYGAHGCGLLLRRDNVLGGNLTNDLTPEVVRGLDAKLTTLSFGLETPPAAVSSSKPSS